MKKKVLFVQWNWCVIGKDDEDGYYENYSYARVGKGRVVNITEEKPHAEGMKWNYLIEFEDGKTKRIFNPNEVEYEK